jgi:catechol 2,3-dioxygenase-like lactoylglutathione lyase family enzyme
MDWELELVAVPVSDVDRAKAFYVDKVGFNADHDHKVSDEMRFVQLTPPGSACSIALGLGITEAAPGSVEGLQLVVADVKAARAELAARGVEVSEGAGLCLGLIRLLRRPGRQPLGRAATAQLRLGFNRASASGP